MPLQARAEATRRRILDSAVDLFDESGYGETGLADILQRAEVSKGAFYYHFDSKEAVAVAVIEEYRHRLNEAVLARIDRGMPLLDRMIVGTFTSAALLETEKSARIGNQLLQALGHVSKVATQIYTQWTAEFVGNLTKAIKAVGVRDGIDAAEFAEAMWVGVLGCHLLSSALGDDPYDRLARAWRTLVRAAVHEEAQDRYNRFLDRPAGALQPVGG